jgi:dihydrofolate reductase
MSVIPSASRPSPWASSMGALPLTDLHGSPEDVGRNHGVWDRSGCGPPAAAPGSFRGRDPSCVTQRDRHRRARSRTYLRTPRSIRSVRDPRSRIPNHLALGMASALPLCLAPKSSQSRIAERRVSDTLPGTVLPEGNASEWAPTAEPAPVRRTGARSPALQGQAAGLHSALSSTSQFILPTLNASEAAMPQVRVHNFSVSLDGFGTGEGLNFDAPFGHAGHRLHEWVFPTRFGRSVIMGQSGGTTGVDNAFAERLDVGFGAEIMGRGKFGPQAGPWSDLGTDDEWRGWWGPNPPFHTPVFVLTHHPRPSIEMEGGTVFYFVDASPQEALDLARQAAGELDVRIGGGPTVVRDFLAADLIDTLHVVLVPIVLGRGVRLWDDLEGIEERFHSEAVSSPSSVTHLTFTRR